LDWLIKCNVSSHQTNAIRVLFFNPPAPEHQLSTVDLNGVPSRNRFPFIYV